jgi:hypothetical protein
MKSVGVLRQLSEDEAERMIAESIERKERDQRSRLLDAEERGIKIGKERGIEIGEERGKGRGIEIGKGEQKIEDARRLKVAGVDIAIIANSLGLAAEEVEAL